MKLGTCVENLKNNFFNPTGYGFLLIKEIQNGTKWSYRLTSFKKLNTSV